MYIHGFKFYKTEYNETQAYDVLKSLNIKPHSFTEADNYFYFKQSTVNDDDIEHIEYEWVTKALCVIYYKKKFNLSNK
jgi:hypothetical protein